MTSWEQGWGGYILIIIFFSFLIWLYIVGNRPDKSDKDKQDKK